MSGYSINSAMHWAVNWCRLSIHHDKSMCLWKAAWNLGICKELGFFQLQVICEYLVHEISSAGRILSSTIFSLVNSLGLGDVMLGIDGLHFVMSRQRGVVSNSVRFIWGFIIIHHSWSEGRVYAPLHMLSLGTSSGHSVSCVQLTELWCIL